MREGNYIPVLKYDSIKEAIKDVPELNMGEEFDECCRAYEAANQGIFQGPYLVKCKYKDAGAFLGHVSTRGIFE